MSEASLAFVCVVGIVAIVACVGIAARHWVRVKATPRGVDIKTQPTQPTRPRKKRRRK